jgi:phage recombination protein Bet
MNAQTQIATLDEDQTSAGAERSLISDMALSEGMEPAKYMATIKAICFPSGRNDSAPTNEEFAAFMMVANRYGLNPLLKEIHAFKSNGKIGTIVGVDGWCRLINDHAQFDGMEFSYEHDEASKPISVTCKMFRKDRAKPIEATEFLAECNRSTEPWNKWPRRMLRHKAMMQAARYAFGFSGIVDDDEFERRSDSKLIDGPAQPSGMEQRFIKPTPAETKNHCQGDALEAFEASLKQLNSATEIFEAFANFKLSDAWKILSDEQQTSLEDATNLRGQQLLQSRAQVVTSNNTPVDKTRPTVENQTAITKDHTS